MKVKTLNEWLNESRPRFLKPTEKNLRKYKLDPNKVTINPDGSIDYNGSVDLSGRDLTSIPFKFNKVKGSFDCCDNRLVSLEGSPEVVNGFDCSKNRLVSLAGAPNEVNGWFYCHYNQLINLVGAPKSVKGKFKCYSNQLVSLAGVPRGVGIGFDCRWNLILYNPTWYEGSFDGNPNKWSIQDSPGEWVEYSGFDHLRMAFERLGELSKEELVGIEEGLKKVYLPDDLRRYCEKELYKVQIKYYPTTKTQKFFHDLEMDDDLLGMI